MITKQLREQIGKELDAVYDRRKTIDAAATSIMEMIEPKENCVCKDSGKCWATQIDVCTCSCHKKPEECYCVCHNEPVPGDKGVPLSCEHCLEKPEGERPFWNGNKRRENTEHLVYTMKDGEAVQAYSPDCPCACHGNPNALAGCEHCLKKSEEPEFKFNLAEAQKFFHNVKWLTVQPAEEEREWRKALLDLLMEIVTNTTSGIKYQGSKWLVEDLRRRFT